MGKLHLVMYSQGEPFNTSKRKMFETIRNCTSREVVCHSYDLQRIKGCAWFKHMEVVSKIPEIRKRDGLHCAYKPFIVNDVYQEMGDEDTLFYADCSKYHNTPRIGFREPLDVLLDFVDEHGHVAGAVASNIWNGLSEPDGTNGICNIIEVWNAIIKEGDNREYFDLYHVCASWFLFKKNDVISAFMKDWIHYCMLTTDELQNPLITYHHTVDQSIFNILVVKYNLIVFFDEDLNHREVKNRNRVMKSINAAQESKRQFLKRILDVKNTNKQ